MNTTETSRKIFLKMLGNINPEAVVSDLIKYNKNSHTLAIPTENLHYNLERGVRVIGFGKAVLGIANHFVKTIPNHITEGALSLPAGMSNSEDAQKAIEQCKEVKIQVFEGAKNNLPDSQSFAACKKILDCVKDLDEDDLVIVIITGGGSALLPHPIPGLSLQEKVGLIEALSKAGADIVELNTVRRQLSLVKGGGLAKFLYPAKVLTLIVSDVIGDPLDLIASGPTVPVTVSCARAVLQKYNLEDKLSETVLESLDNISNPSDYFENINNIILANNSLALKKAEAHALEEKCRCILVSSKISGEAKDVGKVWSEITRRLIEGNLPDHLDLFVKLQSDLDLNDVRDIQNSYNAGSPLVIIGGGETTVRVRGSGKGGRNQEMVLSFAMQSSDILKSRVDCEFLSCGTDGIDGPTDAAGALVSRSIWVRAESLALEAAPFLAENDSYNFWKECGGLVLTGHTGTNLMDVNILYLCKS